MYFGSINLLVSNAIDRYVVVNNAPGSAIIWKYCLCISPKLYPGNISNLDQVNKCEHNKIFQFYYSNLYAPRLPANLIRIREILFSYFLFSNVFVMYGSISTSGFCCFFPSSFSFHVQKARVEIEGSCMDVSD